MNIAQLQNSKNKKRNRNTLLNRELTRIDANMEKYIGVY